MPAQSAEEEEEKAFKLNSEKLKDVHVDGHCFVRSSTLIVLA